MCTVTWIHDEEGYQLFFSRDEKGTRKQATSPRFAAQDGIRFLAPVDGDFGGTWIGVNEFGVSTCLLNGANLTGPGAAIQTNDELPRAAHVHPPLQAVFPKSRGFLLVDLITAPSVTAVCEHLRGADLSGFGPFTIAALEPGQPTALVEWNGAEKTIVPCGEPYLPLTSSSFDAEGVRRKRQDEYFRLLKSSGRLDANVLFEFHRSHGAMPSAYSTCMHRPDAETVSFSWIRVTDLEAEFFYTPAAPCKQSAGESRKLALPSRC